VNIVALVGRLARDPELRYAASTGNAMVRLTVAVDRGLSREKRAEAEQRGQQTADFISCVAWGKTAELIANYFGKGGQIGIQGRIQTGSYQAQDGTKRYTTDVVVDRFHFVGDSGTPQQQSGGFDQSQGFNQNQSFNQNQGFNQADSFGATGNNSFGVDDYGMGDDVFPADDDDIPF